MWSLSDNGPNRPRHQRVYACIQFLSPSCEAAGIDASPGALPRCSPTPSFSPRARPSWIWKTLTGSSWDEFRSLDFAKIHTGMHKPAFVFDGRNILPRAALESLGFKVFAIGKPRDA